jgi:hypothetical protein
LPFCLCKGGFRSDLFSEFLAGTYKVLGKKYESSETYTGSIVISREGNSLLIRREIHGKKTVGKGEVVPSMTDAIPLLKITFEENGVAYKGTYIWSVDLDNHARISGYITRPGENTKNPGMECLFIDDPGDG